jgi:hypothetical protein
MLISLMKTEFVLPKWRYHHAVGCRVSLGVDAHLRGHGAVTHRLSLFDPLSLFDSLMVGYGARHVADLG